MIGTTYDNWQAIGGQAYNRRSCSPNLMLVLGELQRRWPGLTNIGCYGARPIRGSTSVPSSHSWGAAIDIDYPPSSDGVIEAEVCPFLVGRSGELRVSAVHDYRRCRIWHAGRTADINDACTGWWKAQRRSTITGMGQAWANHLHVETTFAGWSDDSPIGDRWTEDPLPTAG